MGLPGAGITATVGSVGVSAQAASIAAASAMLENENTVRALILFMPSSFLSLKGILAPG